ncbi:MAG: SDR family oxidoreductase [Anaerolineae bacterium]|nr:SDR family oxidoreductase [Anaerolineae bacterium]
MALEGKTVLITGAAVRVGRAMALAVAEAGCNVIVHYYKSDREAQKTQEGVRSKGVECFLVKGDLSNPDFASELFDIARKLSPIFALINSASLFQDYHLLDTTVDTWDRHMHVNLRAPFLLSKAFGANITKDETGRIVNVLDWRALRPGADHFAYTISKAGLAAMTRSLAVTLAPNITVNGIAFGAILPPSDGGNVDNILDNVPAKRWANLDEVGKTLLFLLQGPSYITGEIIHLAGGRQLI